MKHKHESNPALQSFEKLLSEQASLWKKQKSNHERRYREWLKKVDENKTLVAMGQPPKKLKEPAPLQLQLNRFSSLLRPSSGECEGWVFSIPTCFNPALDIYFIEKQEVKDKKVVRRWMEWSQGTTFSFEPNDVFYDAKIDGVSLWSDCMKMINHCVQVKFASPVRIEGEGDDSRRHPGSVVFDLLVPDKGRSRMVVEREVTTSQDGLIRYLISGSLEAVQ